VILRTSGARRGDFAHLPGRAHERPAPKVNPAPARVSHAIRRLAFCEIDRYSHHAPRRALSMAIALGTCIVLSGCAAAHGYDSSAVNEDDASFNASGLNLWGWRNCNCGTFGQMDRTEPNDEY
jgi:hypothetical protein